MVPNRCYCDKILSNHSYKKGGLLLDKEEWLKEKRHALIILGWSSLLLLLMVSLLFIGFTTRCGPKVVEKKTVYEEPQVGNCSTGEEIGTTIKQGCDDGFEGERVYVCKDKDKPLELSLDTCKPIGEDCDKVVFLEDIKPIVSAKCVSCHFTPDKFDEYKVAVSGINEWIRRINLGSADPRRMPKEPTPELSLEEKKKFERWKEEGLIENRATCRSEAEEKHSSIDDIESVLVSDLAKIDSQDRPFIRYLVASHRYNLGEDPPSAKDAVDKALNAVVRRSRDITLTSYVDEKKTIYRVDLRSYELSRTDWLRIEAKDPFDLASNTDKGRVLRLLTATRKPWLHFDNFVDVINFNSEIYYDFLNIPLSFQSLADELGVSYAVDLFNLDATLLGHNDSPITNQKNRLLSRHDSIDGYFWVTYDTKALGGIPQRNLYEFPLLKETGSKREFDFAAGEVIFSLPNGLQGYALFDDKGRRQDVAPLDIVRDVVSPVAPAPEIKNAISCHRCHSQGIIPARDEIRAHVLDNASEFDTADVERVKALYKSQTSLNALFNIDNKRFKEAAQKLGLNIAQADPINRERDELRLNWTDEKVAAFLFLKVSDFRQLLDSSDEAKAQVGQLLSGGSISFDQLVQVMPVFIKDFRLFEDPIDGGI